MYGNDDQRDSHSWSPPCELDLSLGDSFSYNNTFFNQPNKYVDLPRPRHTSSNPREPARLSSVSDSSAHLEYLRTPLGDTLDLPPRSPRVSSSLTRPKSTVTSCTSQADSVPLSPPVQLNSLPTPPQSRPPSFLRRSDSPLPDLASCSPLAKPSSSLAPPPSTQTPSSSTPTRQQSKLSPPSSKTSLVPSEGEDLDSFHVRSTYAQLEATGVKGDGYEDGVERTRARQRVSRVSELRTSALLDGAAGKSRDLPAEEVNVLASLDR